MAFSHVSSGAHYRGCRVFFYCLRAWKRDISSAGAGKCHECIFSKSAACDIFFLFGIHGYRMGSKNFTGGDNSRTRAGDPPDYARITSLYPCAPELLCQDSAAGKKVNETITKFNFILVCYSCESRNPCSLRKQKRVWIPAIAENDKVFLMVSMDIIYTDDDMIVVNKPPGVSAHGGENVSGPTVVDFLLPKFPEIASVGDDPSFAKATEGEPNIRPGIVHRLDKDTSGVMVVARNQPTFEALKELFKTRKVEKIYWAVVCGTPRHMQGTIFAPIGRLVAAPLKRGVEQGRSRIRGARDAVTEYRVLKKGESYSLIELKPKTGRMHQLRVHLKSIGHPIACDAVYGGKNVCCPEGCHRQLLHARSLSFSFPEGRRLNFEADAPEDFIAASAKSNPPSLSLRGGF